MEGKIIYFEKPGRDNTEETLSIAKQRAKELDIKTIVVATTVGDTAARAVEVFKGMKLVAVTHYTGMRGPNIQELTDENRQKIEKNGGIILTTMHAFAGVSRATRLKYDTISIGEIISNVLRIFGQGMKVVLEIALMAADSGLADTDEDIIAVAGTGRGADTAVVLTPVNSTNFFDIKVKEILCKPHF